MYMQGRVLCTLYPCVKVCLLYYLQPCSISAVFITVVTTNISIFAVSLQQTTPNIPLVCPGQQLVFSCTTDVTGSVQWQTTGEAAVLIAIGVGVNFTVHQEQFTFQLIAVDGAMLTSTATSEMASSSLDGLQIECSNGNNESTLYVDVPGTYSVCRYIHVQCIPVHIDPRAA